ncbi:MAG: alkaline phosphatase [Bacteroidales bacterium]
MNIEHFPYIGAIQTYSANDFVTDSGAAGTALRRSFSPRAAARCST